MGEGGGAIERRKRKETGRRVGRKDDANVRLLARKRKSGELTQRVANAF